MSRGLGKIQRLCLKVLSESDHTLDSISIAGMALGKKVVSDSEIVSFRRALRKLASLGLVVNMGRGYRWSRRHWALPHVAQSYFKRLEAALGRRAAEKRKAECNFTKENFPDHA